MNKKIQSILQAKFAGINVVVKVGDCGFGGVWCWKGQCHERIPLDNLKQELGDSAAVLKYVRSLPKVRV